MAKKSQRLILRVLEEDQEALLAEWATDLKQRLATRNDLIGAGELNQQCREFLRLLRDALEQGEADALTGSSGENLRAFLSDISRSRAKQGFTPVETATFVFSFKKPLFARLSDASDNPEALAQEVWAATELLDGLGLYTTDVYQQSREEVITRQQDEMLELSTPVVKLWDGVLALPLIGTLDSARTQTVMENLLERIVETGADIAIIDITGVPTVDTLVAQHLMKTVTAARLMGADCIISGIRPQIAQTIVHLGVDLRAITTKASLADAFAIAMRRRGMVIQREKA